MSSRAIPVVKMIKQVQEDPVIPLHWGANQPGMQAKEEVPYPTMLAAIDAWRVAARNAAGTAQRLSDLGVHKQICNRLLEPFQWMRTIVTATEWDNFFALRDHPDAEPHFQMLAKDIRKQMERSTPVFREGGIHLRDSWHLPYVSDDERRNLDIDTLCKISGARCARVSYLTHDGENPKVGADIALYERLVGSTPMHASPIEHQAAASGGSGSSGNFVGWIQYRKLMEELQ